MAVYYVRSDGSDANAGSFAAPWKTPYHAGLIATAGDTVNISGTSATAPIRTQKNKTPILDVATSGAEGSPVTYQGSGGYAYMLKSVDISHGATFPTGMMNFDFESWVSDTADGWAHDSGATTGHYRGAGDTGTYALVLDRTVAGATAVVNTIYLRASTEYTITFHHKSINTANDILFTLKNTGGQGNRYLQATGLSWSSTGASVTIQIDEVSVWRDQTYTFTSDNVSALYSLILSGNGASGSISYDYITITPTAPQAFTWENTSGDTYRTLFDVGANLTPAAMSKATAAAWNAGGITSLMSLIKTASTQTAPEAGKWGWSGTYIYYTLAVGEAIDSLHFEAIPDTEGGAVKITSKDYVNLKNLYIAGGEMAVLINGTSTNGIVSDSHGRNSATYVFNVDGTANATFNGCEAEQSATGDGFTVLTGASVTVTQSISHDNYDDGFNSNTTGTVSVSYSVFHTNNKKDATSSGIETQGTGGNANIFNNVMYGNNAGWVNQATGILTVKNNIVMNNSSYGYHPQTYGTLVADSNIAYLNGTDNDAQWLDVHYQVTDPKFKDAANNNFHLLSTSPAINAGVDVGLTTDAAGRAIKGLPDIGAYEYVVPRRGGMGLDIGISL